MDVQGPNQHDIYKVLNPSGNLVEWNFTKFLVNSSGQIVKHYHHDVAPVDIRPDIEALLKWTKSMDGI